MEYIINSSTGKAEAGRSFELKASLVYIMGYRTARTIERPVSEIFNIPLEHLIIDRATL